MGTLDQLASLEHTMQSSYNQTYQEELVCRMIRYPWILIVSLLIMMVIMSAGVIGNVLVCISMYTCRSLRTANNALLLNLAAADLFACFLFTPLLFTLVIQSLVSYKAVMPRFLCISQGWLRFVCSSVQQITLSSISAQRYAAIAHPLKRKGTKERVLAAVVISWLISACISIAAIQLQSSPIYELCPCSLGLGSGIPTNLVDMYLLGPLGMMCFLIVIFFYAMIFRTVRKHVKEKVGSSYEPTSSVTTANKRILPLKCCQMCGFRGGLKTNVVAPIIDDHNSTELPKHDLLQGSSSLEAAERQHTSNMSIPEVTSDAYLQHIVTDTENIHSNNSMPQEYQEYVNHSHGSFNLLDQQGLERSDIFSGPDGTEDIGETYSNFLPSLETKAGDDNSDMIPEINSTYDVSNTNELNNVRDYEQGMLDTEGGAKVEIDTDKPCEIQCEKLEDAPVLTMGQRETQLDELSQSAVDNTARETNSNGLVQCEDVQDNVETHHVPHSDSTGNVPSVDGDKVLTKGNTIWLASEILPGTSISVQDASTVTKELSTKIYGDVCLMNPKSRERGRRKIEAKTAKRALFIIAAFIICWFPMSIITYLEISMNLPVEVKILVLTLSFLSAVINPIIYTFINTAYRNEFKRLLKKIYQR
ncbi:uncharacterized protein LOC105440462 [Strongylocentrotus purpuratus]|uniref:G-protein coupled receptors family 1 profile domain-containing protein n=1 Tax=Strongylocentrotus purpuratus TaxID=7668 RepID=A0A7M7HHE0_STRPU|nr:uncharacterized protein LOC105440462 [Strongylocentrotus purpuratus]